jgi:hypothetical protein
MSCDSAGMVVAYRRRYELRADEASPEGSLLGYETILLVEDHDIVREVEVLERWKEEPGPYRMRATPCTNPGAVSPTRGPPSAVSSIRVVSVYSVLVWLP